jgi:hypothetical protein
VPALFPEFSVTLFAAEIKRFSIDIHPESLTERYISMAVGVLHKILPPDLSFVSPSVVEAARGKEESLDEQICQDEDDTDDNDAIHAVYSREFCSLGAFRGTSTIFEALPDARLWLT